MVDASMSDMDYLRSRMTKKAALDEEEAADGEPAESRGEGEEEEEEEQVRGEGADAGSCLETVAAVIGPCCLTLAMSAAA